MESQESGQNMEWIVVFLHPGQQRQLVIDGLQVAAEVTRPPQKGLSWF